MAGNLDLNRIAVLPLAGGRNLDVWHAPAADLRALLEHRCVDVAIMSSEHGFSPLGSASDCLSETLGVSVEEIKQLADWNRFDNEKVTLVALRSRRENTALKGLILAPGETARCYRTFAMPIYGRPYRDFYYNVVYEAVSHAATHWGARKVGITHLSASHRFHQDIAICNAEAAFHFGSGGVRGLESLVFFGCCISNESLRGIDRLTTQNANEVHRPIAVSIERPEQVEFIHLSWAN